MLLSKNLEKLFSQTNTINNYSKWLTCLFTQNNLENYKGIMTAYICNFQSLKYIIFLDLIFLLR